MDTERIRKLCMLFRGNDSMDEDVLKHREGFSKDELDEAVREGYLKIVKDDHGTFMGAKKYAPTEKGKELAWG